MKRKHVITTFALSALLGVGVFAGIKAQEVKEVKAADSLPANTVIYLNNGGQNKGWYADGANVYAWVWYTSGSSWVTPTYDVTTTYHKFTLASAATGITLLRESGDSPARSGSTWGTGNGWNKYDAEFITGKDLLNCTSVSSFSSSSWSTYVAPTPDPVYKVSIGGGEAQTLIVNPGNSDEYCLAAPVAFTVGQQLTFTKDAAAYAVTASADGLHDSNNVDADLKIRKAATGNLYLNKTTDKVWVTGFDRVDGNAYLSGSFNNWSGIETTATVAENVTVFQNIDLDADDTFKAWVYHADGADDAAKYVWVEPASVAYAEHYGGEFTAEIDSGDVKVNQAGNYDISVNTSTRVYTIKANDYVGHEYKYAINGGTPVALTKDGNQYKAEGVAVNAGDVLSFTKDTVAYAATAEDASNNNYGKNGIRKAGTVNIYLKPASNNFWVSGSPAAEETATYYMLINDKNPTKMTYNTETEISDNEYYLTHVELKEDDEVTFLYVSDDQTDPVVYSYYNIETMNEAGITDFYKEANKVKADGIYDIYADMTPDHNKLYVDYNHEGWIRYLDVDGLKVRMDVNPENENEYVAQVSLEAGDKLAYYYGPNQASATEQTTTAKAIYNNNLKANKEVLVDTATSVSVYVDIQANTIWAGGITADGYHIIKNHRTLVTMTHGDEYDGFDQWYSNSVDFAQNDTILFLNAHAKANAEDNQHLPEVFGIGTINEAGLGDKFDKVANTDPVELKAKEEVSTKVYLKLKYEKDEVYFGAEDEWVAKAKEFVAGFKTAMQTACNAANKQTTVESAWANQATAYAALTDAAKNTVKEGSTSSVAEIRDFAERYIGIKKQHSTWNLENFLSWEIPTSNYNIFGMQMNDSGITIAAVIAIVSVISAAGLFFIIKRRRQLHK